MVRLLPLFLAALLALPLPALADTLGNLTQKYVNLHYRAEASLRQFDQELEAAAAEGRPGLLRRSTSYRELLALRHLLESVAHEVGETYQSLVKRSQGKDAKAAAAKNRLEAFTAKLQALEPLDKIAAHDLVEDIRSHQNIPGLPRLYKGYEEILEQTKLHRAAIDARVKKTPAASLENEIGAMIRDLELDKMDEAPPPRRPIQPSPGEEGNVSGYDFPLHHWALTYDDGPSGVNTLPILENLQNFGKKATFFWVAENLSPNLAVIEKVREAGMPLNNHSFTHANLPKQNTATLLREVVESTQVQEQTYGSRPRFFRCPYGAGLTVARVRQIIAEQSMVHVFWNVDSLDWKDKDPASILRRLKRGMELEKKGVILMHDIHAQTVVASKLLMEYSAGFDGKPEAHRWVTLPEIVDELNHIP